MYIEYEFIAATFPYYTIKDTYVCTLNYCCQDVKFDFFFFFQIRTDHGLMDRRSALLAECKPCTVQFN